MPDREKVISTLEEIKTQTAEIGLDSAVIAHGFMDKIIALLKEQQQQIWEFQDQVEYLTDKQKEQEEDIKKLAMHCYNVDVDALLGRSVK